MSREDSIIRFDNRSRDARSRVDGELEFGLLCIFGGESLQQKGAKTGASAATKGMEDEKSLE